MIRAFLFRKFSVDENCLYIESPWNPAPGHRNPAPGTRLPLGRPRKNLFGALTAAVAGNGNAKVEQAHHVLCPGPGNAQASPAGRKAQLGVFLKPVHAHGPANSTKACSASSRCAATPSRSRRAARFATSS